MLSDNRNAGITRKISKQTRAWVLERDGYTCHLCGRAAAEPDPLDPRKKVKLTLVPSAEASGDRDFPGNLRAICTNCNEGLTGDPPANSDRVALLNQLHRAGRGDQRLALAWLRRKFDKDRPPEASS